MLEYTFSVDGIGIGRLAVARKKACKVIKDTAVVVSVKGILQAAGSFLG